MCTTKLVAAQVESHHQRWMRVAGRCVDVMIGT
jgi:hypothetical protein